MDLGLAVRTELGTTGINTNNTPTGNAMPNYTQTQTAEKRITFDSAEQARLERILNEVLQQLYDSPPQKYKDYFKLKQKQFDNPIYEYITKLKKWRLVVIATKLRFPTYDDYTEKLQELYSEFNKLDPTIPIERYFADGPGDTKFPGVYLMTLADGVTQERMMQATVLLSGIQWLIRERDKLVVASQKEEAKEDGTIIIPPKVVSTFDDALRKLCIDCLKLNAKGKNVKIGNKEWNKTRLIVALMYVLDNRGTLPTDDEKAYAKLVALIINKDPENLRKNINKHQLTIKPYGCNLKELSEIYIKGKPSDNDKAMTSQDFVDFWEGMYELIDGFIDSQEDLAPLRGKSAQIPSAQQAPSELFTSA